MSEKKQNSRMIDLASDNLSMALAMVSIEAGLLTFILTFHPEEILKEKATFNLTESLPVTISMFEFMIYILSISFFAFAFSFIFSQTAIAIHAEEGDEEHKIKIIESHIIRGIRCFKIGLCSLLAFISLIIYHVSLSSFLVYIILFLCFIFMLLKPVEIGGK